MTTFDDRENAFENKFAHDAEMQFKADARRNKLLGIWAAELLGKTGADAEDYAKAQESYKKVLEQKMKLEIPILLPFRF